MAMEEDRLAWRRARARMTSRGVERREASSTRTTSGNARENDREEDKRRARVAVIGAGAAGLAAMRALDVEGHASEGFDVANDVGGTWAYDEGRETSMYASLRTNLPRELMGFTEFPFDASNNRGDGRRFCGHAEVRRYLLAYAERFQLRERVRFKTKVLSVERIARADEEDERAWSSQWEVTSSSSLGGDEDVRREIFDAVVVANGHYSEPRVPDFDGAENWPGTRMHSHDYRTPEQFEGKKVLIIGAMASGEDMSREIASVADVVFLSARAWQNPEWANSIEGFGARSNIYRKPNVIKFSLDGSVEFEDGSITPAIDVCLYCTGYRYEFPFLQNAGIITVDDNCVAPLYEHCIAANAPSLSFIGLPWKVVPFPMFEIQSSWVARMLSGAVPAPTLAEMENFVSALELTLEPQGQVPRRHAHCFGDKQWEYNDRIARMAGVERLKSWRERMYVATGKNKRANPETYRDANMPDTQALVDALEEFRMVVVT